MDRTLRAAFVAALIGLVGIGGIAAFLGVPATTAIISGVVAGVLFGVLILLAARRADTMAPPAGPDPDGSTNRESAEAPGRGDDTGAAGPGAVPGADHGSVPPSAHGDVDER